MKQLLLACWLASALHAAELPECVDHSVSPYFPPVIRQTYESCAQEVGLYYMMTYAWNRQHGTSAALMENQFAAGFAWHFLNRGENRGAELAEGWQMAQAHGVPTMAMYGDRSKDPLGSWPHGYALYHDAMKYRFMPLATADQLGEAKRWLHERGLLAIEGRLRGFEQNAEKTIVLRWGREGSGHVMTYVGYDDRVGCDVNGDGRLSNDVDLNDDGEITLADWERGAFIAVNSYGREWGDDGKTYVLYRESAVTPFQRGRWAAAVDVLPAYQPHFTLRLVLQTTCQAAVRLSVRADGGKPFIPLLFSYEPRFNPTVPESPERYSRFSTGKRRLSLGPALQDDETGNILPVEIGIDLTGQLPADAPSYTLEFQVDQSAYPHAAGTIIEAHLMRYRPDGNLLSETAFAGLPYGMRAEASSAQASP
jgi:hypothetical protein